MSSRQEVGSYTAKGGFQNEFDIVNKFNDFKEDNEAKLWLRIMGYDWVNIHFLKAKQIPPRINRVAALELGVAEEKIAESVAFKKSDIQVRLEICIDGIYHIENISLKKADVSAGYNQVDKRKIGTYQKFWDMPDRVCETLGYYTGEIDPVDVNNTRDHRRMFLDEIAQDRVDELILFFEENKTLIFNDVLRGRGGLAADWFLVTRKDGNEVDWIMKDINFVCNYFAKGPVEVTRKGNLKIGRMTAQRKGGTPDPKSLQFKINPLDLFESTQ
jgi:R.HinP1I restriction endonuclease